MIVLKLRLRSLPLGLTIGWRSAQARKPEIQRSSTCSSVTRAFGRLAM
ncbi:MAG: hypothetical protein ACJ8FL_02725 [Sphingomicrobium sp.]